jgi:hypothetical protein
MSYVDAVSLQPIGYRAYVARAAGDARPVLYIEQAPSPTKAEAREWVEVARRCCTDPANFAASVVPVYPKKTPNGE